MPPPEGKRTRDARRARETILEAAEVAFAEHGFDGARIETISKASGYNVSLLFQYFGDKLNLYTEVLKRSHEEATDLRARAFAPLIEQKDLSQDARQFQVFLETAIGGLFDHLIEHPRLMRILLWEMADGWQTYARISAQLPTGKIEKFETIFRQARKAGFLRSDFSPTVQLMQALQTCLSYLASMPLYQAILSETDASTVSNLTQAREYLVASVVAGIVLDVPKSDGAR